MIKTKYLTGGIGDIPSMWVFSYYLKLSYQLTGQNVMIKSVFNPKDRTPSMSLYVDKKGPRYKFKDFSTGVGGDKIDLVMNLFNLTFQEACFRIVSEYNKYVLENGGDGIRDYKEHSKYQVVEWKRRKWNVLDRDYWTSYEIGSRELEHFQAWPLDWYRLDNGEKELIITGEYIYGYFTSAGELYKVYQPMVKDRKFLKIKQHTQGLDQLQYKSELLIITKALKDVINLYNMNWESISPDSENTLLGDRLMDNLMIKYPRIVTLFDSDQAGITGMQKYQEKWNIPGIILPLEKDPSDSVKVHGSARVKQVLQELITNKLTEAVT